MNAESDSLMGYWEPGLACQRFGWVVVPAPRDEWCLATPAWADQLWQEIQPGKNSGLLRSSLWSDTPVSVIVCKYCRAWDPTDLRTLGISRVGLFAPRILALVILTAEWGGWMGLAWELFCVVQSRVKLLWCLFGEKQPYKYAEYLNGLVGLPFPLES